MCNYEETTFACGCTATECTEICGYHDDDFAECMNWTTCAEKSDKRACAECTKKQKLRTSWSPKNKKVDDWALRTRSPAQGVEVA